MPIRYEKQGKVVVITLDRPDAMNCMNLEDMLSRIPDNSMNSMF